jgi:hypothetical protein
MKLLQRIGLLFFLITISNLISANFSQKANELTIGSIPEQNHLLNDKKSDGYSLEKLRIKEENITEIGQFRPLIIDERSALPMPIITPTDPPTKQTPSPLSLCEINPKYCPGGKQ